jgi:DNA-binding response OmpR family regulator
MNELIAIIDDEEDIVELVAVNLKKNGFKPKGFYNTAGFLRSLKKQIPDLIILDLMLPDTSGLDLCKQLKSDFKYSAIPIIMLTAKADESDKILGLELGADDYVTKPFSPKELVTRVKTVLRRTETKQSGRALKIGDILALDLDKHLVLVEGQRVELTSTEFRILELLASKRGFVFSRDKILDHLWGEEKIVIDRTIDVHIRNLREKIGKAGKLITNVRGMGYRLEE